MTRVRSGGVPDQKAREDHLDALVGIVLAVGLDGARELLALVEERLTKAVTSA